MLDIPNYRYQKPRKRTFELLTRPESQPKAIKGAKRGYLTFVLHLAPATLSGFEVCPMRSKGCTKACINTAGRGRFTSTQKARLRRTWQYFGNRPEFMMKLHREIAAAQAYADRRGFKLAIRLNGTSDIPWHRIPCGEHSSIMAAYPKVPFYDYTKVAKRLLKETLPANYHLTFSLSEENQADAYAVLAAGGNVAMVYRTKAMVAAAIRDGIAANGNTYPAFSGDETDLRFLDPKNAVCCLYAKGNGKQDQTGFVRELAA